MSGRTQPQLQPKRPAPSEEIPDLTSLGGFDHIYTCKLIMIVFLRWLFEESFPGLRWNLDEEESQLIIGDKHMSYGKTVHKKPRIIVDRGALQWDNISIDKTLGAGSLGTPVQRDGISIVDAFGNESAVIPGSNTVADTFTGSMNIICYAEEGLLAERIASFVWMNIRIFRDKLRKMGFFQIDSSGVGRESPDFATSNYRLVAVPVFVRYTYFVSVVKSVVEDIVEDLGDCGLLEKLNITTVIQPSCKPCSSRQDECDY